MGTQQIPPNQVLMGLALIPMGLFPGLAAATITMLIITSAAAISQQTFTIHSQSIVDERWRTLISGVLNTVMGFAWAVTALAGGQIIERWGYATIFYVGAATTLLTVAIFHLIARRLCCLRTQV